MRWTRRQQPHVLSEPYRSREDCLVREIGIPLNECQRPILEYRITFSLTFHGSEDHGALVWRFVRGVEERTEDGMPRSSGRLKRGLTRHLDGEGRIAGAALQVGGSLQCSSFFSSAVREILASHECLFYTIKVCDGTAGAF